MTICHGKGAQWGGRGSDPLQQCLMRIKNTTGGCPNGSIPYAGRHTYSPDVWTALNNLPQRVGALLKKYESSNAGGFEDFERELHALFAQTQCAVTEEALARHDVDLPFVFIGGERYRRACRCAQTYLTATGAVSVTRTLYQVSTVRGCVGLLADSDLTPTHQRRHRRYARRAPPLAGSIGSGGKQRHVPGGRGGTIQRWFASTGTVSSRGLFAK